MVAEIEGKLNDKIIQENEIYKEILELLKNQAKEGGGRNEIDD